MKIKIELYYSRFGALARPYLETVGFDYNRVYNNFEEIIQDFGLNNWKLVSTEKSTNSDEVLSLFCVFQKGD